MLTKLYFDDVNSDFEYSTTLDNVEYILRFKWNTISNSWYLSIKDYAGTEIINGVRLVTSFPLINIYKSIELPSGILVVIQNIEGSLQTPTRDSFSSGTHEIVYYTEDEMNEILT